MSSNYRSSIVENDSLCATHNSQHNLTVHLRSSVEVKTTFVLNVEHQVASIQVLHYEEEVLLCKKKQTQNTKQDCQQTVLRK